MIDLVIDPFDPDSIKKSYEIMKRYSDTFEQRCDTFCQRLLEQGVEIAKKQFSATEYDGPTEEITVTVEKVGENWQLTASGTQVFFIEFGTGVYFNGAESYPGRPVGVVGIGQYGKGLGKNEGWYYGTGDGEAEYTHGNRSAKAMFAADLQVRAMIETIAKEVFAQ